MTAGPTQAMAAAARGEGFAIGYGGIARYDYAPAVSRAFVRAASVPAGAVVANFPGRSASMEEVVAAIEAAAPEVAGQISWEEAPLPFPARVEMRALEAAIGTLPQPPLAEGIAETISLFQCS
jgi:nucleoside-diphosphate-sugar epimerase